MVLCVAQYTVYININVHKIFTKLNVDGIFAGYFVVTDRPMVLQTNGHTYSNIRGKH